VLELTLRLPATAVEDVLDSLLPALPAGVHRRDTDAGAELTIALGPGTPSAEQLERLAGPAVLEATTAEASDDWRERRLGRYQPLLIAERFLIRPEWAPRHGDPRLIEIVLEQSTAFGTAMHPTTQACLATLAALEPAGSFADCGCGSGVLSIAAARLGFSPLTAVDVDPGSVAAAEANCARNEVEVEVRSLDLASGTPPAAGTIAANIPAEIQLLLASGLGEAPRQVIASGFGPAEIPAVAEAWAGHGLRIADQVRANEWSVLLLR
jgi:ribosomal protein L11 methyltransferase